MRFFKIVYEVVGGKYLDEILIWSNNISNAIKEFENTEIDTFGFKVKYTQYSIKQITV